MVHANGKVLVPTLETLVNQCCEDDYNKLNGLSNSVGKLPVNKEEHRHFTSQQFRQFIIDAHCLENLSFLIETFYYEKIWNKIFKRQSSILKCKDDSLYVLRQKSVATITNASRQHSLGKESEFHDHSSKNAANQKAGELSIDSSSQQSGNNDTVTSFTLPAVIKGQSDFDCKSFVNCEFNSPDSVLSSSSENDITTKPRTLTASSKASNKEVWDSLFKSSYCHEDQKTQCTCLCNNDLHTVSTDTNQEEEDQFNDSAKQLEIREKLKNELSEKYEYIVHTYVLTNSINEINLPSDVHTNLIKEFENDKVLYHSPLTLLPARNAVLQLLRENIYHGFISQQEFLMAKYHPEQKVVKPPSPKTNPTVLAKFDQEDSNGSNDLLNNESASSASSIRRPGSPILSLSNFLNKHHLKLHSSSTSIVQSTDQSSIKSDCRDTPEKQSMESFKSADHKHTKYLKGPCNIEPTASAYNPKPPEGKSTWGARFMKFKSKKKANTGKNNGSSLPVTQYWK